MSDHASSSVKASVRGVNGKMIEKWNK